MEQVTPSGLVIERRSSFDVPPNGNPFGSTPPHTVGPTEATPGVVGALEINEVGTPGRSRSGPPRSMPWSGWPAEWATPNWWGRVEELTDTAWACLDVNSMILSTMPAYIVNGEGTPPDWLVNPNPDLYTAWPEFAKQLFWDYMLGEVFVLATARYDNGLPARFHVVPPWFVNAEMVGGRRRYSIGGQDVTSDVLHIRYKSTTSDAHGHGPLEVGAARVVAASALLRYATDLAAAGGIPYAVLVHEGRLTPSQAEALQWQWVGSRMATMGLPGVLSNGIKLETLSIDPEKMALLDLSRWNESRIAVLLGVPPFLVGLPSGGDPMTYSNTQWVFIFHWRAHLNTRARMVMSALSQWALTPGETIELNRDEYTHATLYERAQTWEILERIGVLTAEQIGQIERFSVAGGSESFESGVFQ